MRAVRLVVDPPRRRVGDEDVEGPAAAEPVPEQSRGLSKDLQPEVGLGVLERAIAVHGRPTEAGEVAAACVFLASDASSGITGEDMNVSAGLVMY